MVVYRRVTGPYVSCALRPPELQSIFKSDAQYQSFLEKFAEVGDVADMAKRFGFLKRPHWQVATEEKFSKKQKVVLAALVMYSMDVESQFQKMQGATKVESSLSGKENLFASDSAAGCHVRPLAKRVQVGRFFSVPASGIAVQSLQSSLQPLHLQTGGSR